MNTENLHSLSKALAYVESPFSRWIDSTSFEVFESLISGAENMAQVMTALSTSKAVPDDVAEWCDANADNVTVFAIRMRSSLIGITSPIFSIYDHLDEAQWSEWDISQHGCCLTSDRETWKELYDDALNMLQIMTACSGSHDVICNHDGCYRELFHIQLVDDEEDVLWDNEKAFRSINDTHDFPYHIIISDAGITDIECHDICEAISRLEEINDDSRYQGESISMSIVMDYYGHEYPIRYSGNAQELMTIITEIDNF